MTLYGNNGSSYWRAYLNLSTSNISNTTTRVYYNYGIYLSKELHKDHGYYIGYDTKYIIVNGTRRDNAYKKDLNRGNTNQYDYIQYESSYFDIPRTTATRNISVYLYIRHEKTYSGYVATSTISTTVSIPARPLYTVSFNANTTDAVSNMPSSVSKYYGYSVAIPSNTPTREGFAFQGWATSPTGGVSYRPSQTYSADASATLYAKWGATDPPSLTVDSINLTTGSDPTNYIIRGITNVSVSISGIEVHHTDIGRSLEGITLYIGDVASAKKTTMTDPDTLTISGSDFTQDGKFPMYIVTADQRNGAIEASGQIDLGEVTVIAPQWSKEIKIDKDPELQPPRLTQNGDIVIDSFKVWNYTTNDWDDMPTSGLTFVPHIDEDTPADSYWGFDYTFDEDHVSNKYSLTPTILTRVFYRHYDANYGLAKTAFFNTTRNQNYSNGIYNVMFVGGCDNEQFPNFTSRVWWCKINDPLYFPDTNYLEVGSNDTAVQGLTKVGDYLGVVKQSKTTDTAIFLVYPTSFEEETTYAVKQGVQGVGALARYSFNILGDETLFLSPNGIMAIVPSADMEHKVQNRSYFVDKQMLAESEIENSYSFVHDGKYYLAIGNGVGSVYVLDGNQRNSWGNNKTNLVYECYYLENIPAKCFVKFNDKLTFSTENEVCIVRDEFLDAYDSLTGDVQVPVKAKWSTIFDDDGALHYYKTMQKKGNLISILPLDQPIYYKEVTITEEEFDENKTLYWTYDGTKYVQCTESDEFSLLTQYYIQHRSATKVYVRKDDKDPVEITRSFGYSSEIPSELFINKKFKKYKRLQFILRNEEAEDFGVDEIVKNYTVGNYAKR